MPLKIPSVIGHRGNRNAQFYENSLAALNDALAHADGFETDVVKSADGQIFFVHDTFYTGHGTHYELHQRLDEASKQLIGDRRIDQTPAAEIKKLRLKDGTPLPSFDDLKTMIAHYPEAIFNLELKGENTAETLIRSFGTLPAHDRFVLSSFNHDDLLLARRMNPAFPLAVLYEPSNTFGCPMYSWNPSSTAAYVPFSVEHLHSKTIRAIKPDYFNLNEYDLRPEILKAIREVYPQAKVMIWWWYTEPEPQRNQCLIHTLQQLIHENLLDMLAAIISDYPAQMRAMLNKEFGSYVA